MAIKNFIVIVGLIIVVLMSSVAWILYVLGGGDPLDRFEVVRIASEQGSKRIAVTYLYYHANSSNRFVSTWLSSATPPSIGSNERPRGGPTFTWSGKLEELKIEWSQGRLHVSADRIDMQTNEMNDCYFSYDTVRRLCIYPKAASVVTTQTK